MGIHKLLKYINSNFHDWEDISLQDTPLVLDGNGLNYHLFKIANVTWKFGGQYPALRNIAEGFFDSLTRRNVNPICVVLDGVGPVDKLETLRARKEERQQTIIDIIDGVEAYGHQSIYPPLISQAFRKFLEDYQSTHDNLRVYSGDEEADTLGVTIANKYNCPLLGEDSDYFISSLRRGYVPYSKLTWSGPGSPVTGKVYFRNSFARNLGIEPDLVIAIPALVGNDSISNLVEETSLKRVRDNPRYRGNDIEKGIVFIKRQGTLVALESNLQMNDGDHVVGRFRGNLQKAREMYEGKPSFDEGEFRMTCSYKTKSGGQYPAWMIEQYRDLKLSKNFFEVLLNGVYFHRVIPDDYHQQSAKIFSRPIREEMFGIMEVGQVKEVVRIGHFLLVQLVHPRSSDVSIFRMQEVAKEERIRKLCTVLLCNPGTLSSLDHQWYVPIASVCFWAKTAGIAKHDFKLKALLLCFAECFKQSQGTFEPQFDVHNLHILTQWQCVYHDAVLLNQILALPLPSLSPAFLFDGKVASYYYQQGDRYLDARLAEVGKEVRSLYEKLLEAVRRNI